MPLFNDAANGITAQDLLPGIAYGESGANPATRYGPWTKHGRAMGEYQIMPDTARRFGYNPEEMFDPTKGADVATKYLTFLLNRYGNAMQAIEAYNTGEGNIDKGVIPPETQSYTQKVLGYLQGHGGKKIGTKPAPAAAPAASPSPPSEQPDIPFITNSLLSGLFGKGGQPSGPAGGKFPGETEVSTVPQQSGPKLGKLFQPLIDAIPRSLMGGSVQGIAPDPGEVIL